VLGWLRALLGQKPSPAGPPRSDQPAELRLEAAKRRLKETIPPPED
jgi:hypothetical protein